MKRLLFLASALITASSVHAAIIEFDLIGTAGAGLLPGNEPGTVTGGTGGEFGTGILYNDVTNLLDLTNVGWGSSQSFSDLSNTASASHIHGPTAGNNGGGGFTQTAVVLINLTRSSSAITGGFFTNPLQTLTAAQETDLLNGKWYINIHTTGTNSGGEIRGFLVPAPVPEPATATLAAVGLVGFLARRRRTA